jgi:hypothetical protein
MVITTTRRGWDDQELHSTTTPRLYHPKMMDRVITNHKMMMVGGIRTLITEVVEPDVYDPSSLEEHERCTIILAEDGPYEKVVMEHEPEISWKSAFSDNLPNVYGFPYAELELDNEQDATKDMYEVKEDLANIERPILICKGSWMSFVAQYYLQMYPLTALVMVNPLILDKAVETQWIDPSPRGPSWDPIGILNSLPGAEYATDEHYMEQPIDESTVYWTLKIPPGLAPMMIMTTRDTLTLYRHAIITAKRHSVPDAPPVLVTEFFETEPENTPERALEMIVDWIRKEVLVPPKVEEDPYI